jgi:hypothetical protein
MASDDKSRGGKSPKGVTQKPTTGSVVMRFSTIVPQAPKPSSGSRSGGMSSNASKTGAKPDTGSGTKRGKE